jgi:uncharacterized protein (DUF2141 family)
MALLLCGFKPANQPLKITIKDIKKGGNIHIGLYKPGDKFPGFNSGRGWIIDPKNKPSITYEIDDIPYGEYAVAVFEDLDGDTKLKTRIFGIPAEPIGVSNNVLPKFGPPKYSDCKFIYSEKNSAISIKLVLI